MFAQGAYNEHSQKCDTRCFFVFLSFALACQTGSVFSLLSPTYQSPSTLLGYGSLSTPPLPPHAWP